MRASLPEERAPSPCDFDQALDGVNGFLNGGTAVLVKIGGGDGGGRPFRANLVEVHVDQARVGMKRFLLLPALFVQAEKLGLSERVALRRRNACGVEGEFGEVLVKIVAAQRFDSFRGQHGVLSPAEFHQRGVEGAAAQVVDQNVLFLFAG